MDRITKEELNYLKNMRINLTNKYTNLGVDILGEFYSSLPSPLDEIFPIYHLQINAHLKYLNNRISTGHYTAEESREFLDLINDIKIFQINLSETGVAFEVDPIYQKCLDECKQFLKRSGGSSIPPNFSEVRIIEIRRVFNLETAIGVTISNPIDSAPLKAIGNGSYATVHKYKDPFYNCFFAVKKALKNLSAVEYERFQQEFTEMRKLKSPYILKVYKFDEQKREYIMEYADDSLYSYITKFNNSLDFSKRNSLIQQTFKAFIYLHSKQILHRDISPTNVLIKKYDDTEIIKLADFGLIKLEESQLTNLYTEKKGVFNDPLLTEVGFSNYKTEHEIYALTRLIYFIVTAKMHISTYPNEEFKLFIEKGIHRDPNKRYKNVQVMRDDFRKILPTLASSCLKNKLLR